MKKKVYIAPELTQVRVQTESMVALSLFGGEASQDGTVLTKGQNDWNIWGGGNNAAAPTQENYWQ